MEREQQKLETAYLLKKTRQRPWGLIVLGVLATLMGVAAMVFYVLK